MYLRLGPDQILPLSSIVGIFDMDNTTWSYRTRDFLETAESEGRVVSLGMDLPRSFVVCQEGEEPPIIYMTPLSSAVLKRRAAEDLF